MKEYVTFAALRAEKNQDSKHTCCTSEEVQQYLWANLALPQEFSTSFSTPPHLNLQKILATDFAPN